MPSSLASAIAQLEGFGPQGNIPTLSNNPGDLEIGDVGYGTVQAAGGNKITVFGSLQDGWSALENQINKIFNGTSAYYNPSTTIQQFGTTYSGGNQNYGVNLANKLGVDPSATLGSVQQQTAPTSSNSGNPLDWGPFNQQVFGHDLSGSSLLTNSLVTSRLVILVVGILLLAAGLFSFKQTQVIIQKAAKTAAQSGG
jgi:hypothetical protein